MAEVASSAPAAAGETPAAQAPAPAPDAAASREAAPMDVDDNSSEDPILVSLESEAKHVAHAPLQDRARSSPSSGRASSCKVFRNL